MKVATVSAAGERCVGQIAQDGTSTALFDLALSEAQDGILPLIRRNGVMSPTLSPTPLSEVMIEAPIPVPRRDSFCVSKNYYEHPHEFARGGLGISRANGAVPGNPNTFSKVPESVSASGNAVVIDPKVSKAVDDEAELAVIIGKAGRFVDPKNAFDHVWGYTIINDVTAPDLQARDSQWPIGKSQDKFCPMGPFAVTRDEIDIGNTPIKCSAERELRQSSNTGLLIFDVPKIIETLSAGITLQPGDVVATGAPAGVGIGFDPPKYLKGGEVVPVEIGGISVLENEIVERTP
jgi:2-keto-4-pentenoate hydratase/2-oxohepta-3-ene-1,7-dioic acid hydratase in catechol pathway